MCPVPPGSRGRQCRSFTVSARALRPKQAPGTDGEHVSGLRARARARLCHQASGTRVACLSPDVGTQGCTVCCSPDAHRPRAAPDETAGPASGPARTIRAVCRCLAAPFTLSWAFQTQDSLGPGPPTSQQVPATPATGGTAR